MATLDFYSNGTMYNYATLVKLRDQAHEAFLDYLEQFGDDDEDTQQLELDYIQLDRLIMNGSFSHTATAN